MKELGSKNFEYLHLQPYLNIYWKDIKSYIYIYMTCTEEATEMAAKYLLNKKMCF